MSNVSGEVNSPNGSHLQHQFVTDVLPRIQQDSRVVCAAIAGSMARGTPDTHSDVDLIVVVEDSAFEEVMSERFALISAWAGVVAAFTGEHVGEPRLVITLVGPPLLHVDFKFVSVSDFIERGDEPVILWARNGTHPPSAPPPVTVPIDPQWIEDRFWVWVHYGATKLGRGELFEVISFLNYLRETVLAPLITRRVGAPARGVRHLEFIAPNEASALRTTVCGYDRNQAGQALLATVKLYRRWRDEAAIDRLKDAEDLAVQYLHQVISDESTPPDR